MIISSKASAIKMKIYGFETETSVLFSKLCRFFRVYRNKSLPSVDDFWSILKIIHWAFVFSLGLWR